MRLGGKTAVITGAAGDIGGAAARQFLREGAMLALVDRDERGIADLGASLGPSPLIAGADITDENAVRQAAEAVRSQFGTIDILFVNAGVEQSHIPLVDMTKADFERVVGINLTGAFLTAKHFVPLIADRGSIIMTSSVAAISGIPAYAAYSASKAGLLGLMRSASLDVAPRGIRCNIIFPGPVKSRMLDRSAREASADGDTTAFYAAMSGMSRLGRLVEPDDIASLALFLASDESSMISGQTIAVDGGSA